MKKRAAVLVAVGSVATAAGSGLPVGTHAASARTSQQVSDPGKAPELTTADDIRSYLEHLGVSQAQVKAFAAKLGIGADDYYEAVLRASDGKAARSFPVELVDGKVRYTNTVFNSMKFTRTSRSTQAGKAVQGRCVFDPIGGTAPPGEAAVSEVVEVDPASCTRTVVQGAYDPAAQTPTPPATTSATTFLDCSTRTGPPTRYQPSYDWVDGEWRAYYKQSFVDPICITITSSTLNVRWKNAVNSSTDVSVMPGTTGRLFYYTDLGENWPSSQKLVWLVPQQTDSSSSSVSSDTSSTKNYEVTTFLGHQRTETDFPEHLLAVASLFGISGLTVAAVACATDFSDTGFNSQQTLKARRNGYYFMSGSGDVWGGCSSLVHERTWYGSGAYAR